MKNRNKAGHLCALLTIIIWGTTFISTKILLVDFQPVEILFFRFVMGLLALLIIYPHRLKVTTKRQELTFAPKCVMVIDENLPLGIIANTAAIMGQYAASTMTCKSRTVSRVLLLVI